jgi:hypothetical protein
MLLTSLEWVQIKLIYNKNELLDYNSIYNALEYVKLNMILLLGELLMFINEKNSLSLINNSFWDCFYSLEMFVSLINCSEPFSDVPLIYPFKAPAEVK